MIREDFINIESRDSGVGSTAIQCTVCEGCSLTVGVICSQIKILVIVENFNTWNSFNNSSITILSTS